MSYTFQGRVAKKAARPFPKNKIEYSLTIKTKYSKIFKYEQKFYNNKFA